MFLEPLEDADVREAARPAAAQPDRSWAACGFSASGPAAIGSGGQGRPADRPRSGRALRAKPIEQNASCLDTLFDPKRESLLPGLTCVLDQQNLVTGFVVNQLIDQL